VNTRSSFKKYENEKDFEMLLETDLTKRKRIRVINEKSTEEKNLENENKIKNNIDTSLKNINKNSNSNSKERENKKPNSNSGKKR